MELLTSRFAAEPQRPLTPRLTGFVCVVAACITLILILTSTPHMRPGDGLFVVLALSPYLAIGLLARGSRGNRIVSTLLFAIAVLLALGGIILFAWDSYQYHMVVEHRMVQRMTVLVVPLLQWVAVLLVILVLLLKLTVGRIKSFSIDRRADRV
jgi:hypothetical protein